MFIFVLIRNQRTFGQQNGINKIGCYLFHCRHGNTSSFGTSIEQPFILLQRAHVPKRPSLGIRNNWNRNVNNWTKIDTRFEVCIYTRANENQEPEPVSSANQINVHEKEPGNHSPQSHSLKRKRAFLPYLVRLAPRKTREHEQSLK